MTSPRELDGAQTTQQEQPAEREWSVARDLKRARIIAIDLLEAQAAHVQRNADALRKYADTEHEARCRELCGSYLRELASAMRLQMRLDEMEGKS